MGSSGVRRVLRLLRGVTRKFGDIRWTKHLPVGGRCSRMKADKGAERSLPSHGKTRRGLRAGKTVSAIGTAAPVRTAPLGKNESSRVVNHKGRKYLWAVKAANRLASSGPATRLLQALPDESGNFKRFQSEVLRVNKERRERNPSRLPLWSQYRQQWVKIAHHAQACGIPPIAAVDVGPWKFLKVRSPKFGAADLLELAFFVRPDPPRPPEWGEERVGNAFVLAERDFRGFIAEAQGRVRGRVCRLCGEYGHFGSECLAVLPNRGRRGGGRRPTRGRRS